MAMLGASDVRMGCQGFTVPDWHGSFYPRHVSSPEFLSYYARVFDFVEIDSSFYAISPARNVLKWRDSTPASFRFAAKVPQAITHDPHPATGQPRLPLQGEGWQVLLEQFVERMRPLSEKLLALVVQLPPQWHWRPERLDVLRAFVEALPRDLPWAVEFRHRGWLNDEVFALLQRRGVAFVIQDLYYMPVRVEATSDNLAYVRLQGQRQDITRLNALQIERDEALDFWANTVRELATRPVRTVVVAANNHYQGFAPGTIAALQRRLGLPVSATLAATPHQRELPLE